MTSNEIENIEEILEERNYKDIEWVRFETLPEIFTLKELNFEFSKEFVEEEALEDAEDIQEIENQKSKFLTTCPPGWAMGIKHPINHTFFDDIDSEAKAYILGLIYADGCMEQNRYTWSISLKRSDRYLLEKISNYIFGCRNLQKTRYNNARSKVTGKRIGLSQLKIDNAHMCSSLEKYGVTPFKMYSSEFPTLLREEFYPHFIRGMIDGDGWILPSKNRQPSVHLLATPHITNKLCEILDKFKWVHSVDKKTYKQKDGKDGLYELRIRSYKNCVPFLEWIYKDATIWLERKYNKAKNIFKDNEVVTKNIRVKSKIQAIADYIKENNCSLREASEVFGCESHAVSRRLKEIGISVPHTSQITAKKMVQDDFFQKIECREDAYLLAMFMEGASCLESQGRKTVKLTMTNNRNNIDLIEDIADYMINERSHVTLGSMVGIQLRKEKLFNTLTRQYNIGQKKDDVNLVSFPSTVSKDLRAPFIQGLLDYSSDIISDGINYQIIFSRFPKINNEIELLLKENKILYLRKDGNFLFNKDEMIKLGNFLYEGAVIYNKKISGIVTGEVFDSSIYYKLHNLIKREMPPLGKREEWNLKRADHFQIIDTADKAYILGFVLGCCRITSGKNDRLEATFELSDTQDNRNIMKKISSFIHGEPYYALKRDGILWMSCSSSNNYRYTLCNLLWDTGIRSSAPNSKEEAKVIPVSKEFLNSYLRGILDSCEMFYNTIDNYLVFELTRHPAVNQNIIEILSNNDIKTRKTDHGLQIIDVDKFYNLIYFDSGICREERKNVLD